MERANLPATLVAAVVIVAIIVGGWLYNERQKRVARCHELWPAVTETAVDFVKERRERGLRECLDAAR